MIFSSNYNKMQPHPYSYTLDLKGIDALDALPDASFVAYYSAIGNDYVLMQNVAELKTTALPQLQPYTNKRVPTMPPVISSHNDSNLPQIRGYIAEPNYTTQVRNQSIILAKYICRELSAIYTLLLNLKTIAPTQSCGQILHNQATSVYVLNEVNKNILSQLSNNPNVDVPMRTLSGSKSYCVGLHQALEAVHNVIVAIIKLNQMLVIPNINPWLNNGLHTMWCVLGALDMLHSSCK